MDLKTFGTYTRADQLYMVSSSLNFESWFGFHLFNHVNVPWSDWCCCWFCRNKNSVLFFVITGFVWQKCVTTQLLYSGFLNFTNVVKVTGRYLLQYKAAILLLGIKSRLGPPWYILDLTSPLTLSLQIQTLSYFDSVLRKLPVEVSTKTIIYHNVTINRIF